MKSGADSNAGNDESQDECDKKNEQMEGAEMQGGLVRPNPPDGSNIRRVTLRG